MPSSQQLELLRGLVEPRGEAGRVQEPPEVVARVGEVRAGRVGDAAGVDAAEDDAQPRREDVGYRAWAFGRVVPPDRLLATRPRPLGCDGRASSRLARAASAGPRRIPSSGSATPRRRRPDDEYRRVPAAVAAGVALGFRQRSEPSHSGAYGEVRTAPVRRFAHVREAEGVPLCDRARPGRRAQHRGRRPLDPPEAWTPEHLLLAAVVRCSLDSLRHHAKRAGIEVARAAASAHALVTRRESDGRYAVVEAGLTLGVELEPRPDGDALAELLARAERDCFVGASLTAEPSYTWNVARSSSRAGPASARSRAAAPSTAPPARASPDQTIASPLPWIWSASLSPPS